MQVHSPVYVHWEATGQLQMSSSIISHPVFCEGFAGRISDEPGVAGLLDWLVNETQGPACLLIHPALRSKKQVFGVQTKILMHRKHSAHWATSA